MALVGRIVATYAGTIGLLVVWLLLAGCGLTPGGDLARSTIATKGAAAYDAGLENAEWFICQAASVGSIKRRYGKAQETADAWREICEGQDGIDLIGPPADDE